MVEPTPIHRANHDPPEALSDEDAALLTRVRLKLERGARLAPEERAILGRLPSDQTILPTEGRAE